MKINSTTEYNNYSTQRNKQAFKAVIPSYYSRAAKTFNGNYNHHYEIVLDLLDNVLVHSKVSQQDGIDTLEALKVYFPNCRRSLDIDIKYLKEHKKFAN